MSASYSPPMPLSRCTSCRALVELAEPVAVAKCQSCGGVLLPVVGSAPVAVLEDEPTRPRMAAYPTWAQASARSRSPV